MSILTKVRELLADGAKRTIRLGGTGAGFNAGDSFIRADLLTRRRREEREWKIELGDLWGTNIVLSCLNWEARQFPRARQVVYRPGPEGQPVILPDHPALPLLRRPNNYMTPRNLWAAVLLSLNCEGIAYLWAERDGAGAIMGLHYLPHFAVQPKESGDVAAPVSHYEYQVGAIRVRMAPIGQPGGLPEIVCLRHGVDPRNRLKGLGPLSAIFREAFTDEEGAAAAATLLENMGVPGAVFSPRMIPEGMDPNHLVPPEFAETVKRLYRENTTGANRGGAIVLSVPFEVTFPAISPGVDLGRLRDIPEERITAAMGYPAAIVGLGAGLAQTTNRATADALERWAWQHGIMPRCGMIDEGMTLQLMPQFYPYGAEEGDEFGRDYAGIEALQEKEAEQYKRLTDAVGGPWLAANEARAQVGLPPLPGGDELRSRAPAAAPGATGATGEEGGGKARRPFQTKQISGPAPDLFATLDEFRAALAAREASAIADMEAAYQVVADAVQQRLDLLEARMVEAAAAGEEITEGWLWRQERYQALLTQAERSMTDLSRDGVPVLTAHQAGYAEAALGHAETLTHAAMGDGPAGVSVIWHRVPSSAIESLVGFASDGSPLADLIAELAVPFRETLREGLMEGIGLGISPREVARRVAPGVDGFRRRVLTIMRTETMRAYREAARQNYAANDVVIGIHWVATLDTRTCPSCWALHGTLLPPGSVIDDHPNGRCVGVPATKSWREVVGDPTLPDTRPAIEPGEAIFGRLAAGQQREILGDGMYERWAAGEVPFARLSVQVDDPRWGTMRRAATIAEATGAQ